MGTFTTKLELGATAFGVSGGLDPSVIKLTVGQVRIIQTHPKYRLYADESCYEEQYMCVETGVGSGTLWGYGKNIFATEKDAQRGVVEHRQRMYKERANRDAREAEQKARQRESDLATLRRLQEQYGEQVVKGG